MSFIPLGYAATGRREVAEMLLVTLLTEAVIHAAAVAADHWRKRQGLWRCAECGKSHAPPAPVAEPTPTEPEKPKPVRFVPPPGPPNR